MKETDFELFSPQSPGCCPPGSLTDARLAEAPSSGDELTLEENTDMEVKQVTLYKRSGEVKQHSKKYAVLTAEAVSRCLSHFGYSDTGLSLHQLSLPSLNLGDISILCNYVRVAKVDLPHNKIKDLSCVSHMPYLVSLDASHNEIFNFFGFQPPMNLKVVNFSHNRMTKMKDLSAFSFLTILDLDHNSFNEITGLEQCYRLIHLSLAHNKISRISGLGSLPLTYLCLRGNQLKGIEGLDSLKSLRVLDLSLNRITSLSGLQSLYQLRSINLETNLITEVQECRYIHDLFMLTDLNLLGNPLQEQQDYRLSVVFLLQHLTVLDQQQVTAEEKVSSVNQFDPPLDVVGAQNHMTHLMYWMMQPHVLYESTLPSADTPYPMLVLTGPQGCGKRELVHRVCQEFSEYFAYGICHTTRGPYFGEENGIDYHFVIEEDFQNMIHMGKFIQTMDYGGHRFGLSRDSIENVAREGLACCVHMELEGVFSLKKSYFEPRYILLIPTQVEKYTDRLKSRGLYTSAQIEKASSRIELYANTNRDRPGFFDNVIPCDDCEEAYHTLRQVLKEYLLLDEKEGENNRASPDNASIALVDEPEEKPPLSTSGSAGLTSHSATVLNPSDPSYRNYFTKIKAELGRQKSPAELASIKRRERLVREALVGKSPGVYSQIFKSSAQKAPSSLHTHDSGTRCSEDSSSDESRASSALSVPSSAGALAGLVEPLNTLEMLKASISDHLGTDQSSDTPCPGTDQLAAAVSPSSDRRPGSNAKPILPPIPTGRKTPAVPSPASSPRPNTNVTSGEGGDTNMERSY